MSCKKLEIKYTNNCLFQQKKYTNHMLEMFKTCKILYQEKNNLLSIFPEQLEIYLALNLKT